MHVRTEPNSLSDLHLGSQHGQQAGQVWLRVDQCGSIELAATGSGTVLAEVVHSFPSRTMTFFSLRSLVIPKNDAQPTEMHIISP